MDAYSIARPILFELDPERAHNVGLSLIKFASKVSYKPIPTRTALGDLANPIGLAAGYDKTGRYVRSLSKLGFGYIVAGTFTKNPWQGNPKPRVARNREEQTLVNALGFPNPGIDAFIASLTSGKRVGVPVVASISGGSIEDIVLVYSKIQPHVAGVELNLSSPNTPILHGPQGAHVFRGAGAEDGPGQVEAGLP